MIKELRINNLAIIKEMNLDIESSFLSMTGETGAGKSIILDGISLILGGRANTNVIRQEADKLQVFAVIEIDDKDIEKINSMQDSIFLSENELIIYREVSKSGKSKITINDKRVSLTTLKNITYFLVDIVGQHENQYLLNQSTHIKLLDAFLKNKPNLEILVNDIKKIDASIEKLDFEKRETLEKREFYEYSIKEIEKLNLYVGIDEELENEYKIAFNSGRIKEAYSSVCYEIDTNVIKSIKKCVKLMDNIQDVSFDNKQIYDRLDSVLVEVSDIYEQLLYTNMQDSNDEILEDLFKKLNSINKIKNKYKESIENILKYKDELKLKLENLDYSDTKLKELEKLKANKISEYKKKAEELSNLRKKAAKNIESEVNLELSDLNMKEASFKINFETRSEFNKEGNDIVEFYLRTNKGFSYNKLSKIASGGEISRIMLALKVVFSRVDELKTLIFDEIDAGISGETVKMVAKKLKKLSKEIQVICVTHSPNIAIQSSEQYLIKKSNNENQTLTTVKKLTENERVCEIARIISGNNITSELKSHIKKEIEMAKNGI